MWEISKREGSKRISEDTTVTDTHMEQFNILLLDYYNTGEGEPISPDSITQFCSTYSKKNGLSHINPHAFRHTMASVLFFSGVDSVSISKRLGHSKVSTTADIYSHIMKKADERSAEYIADVFLRHSDKKA